MIVQTSRTRCSNRATGFRFWMMGSDGEMACSLSIGFGFSGSVLSNASAWSCRLEHVSFSSERC